MESRKVQRAGYSSLSVTLPIDWINEVGLKQGDMVFVMREKDSSLKLLPSVQAKDTAEDEEFIIYSDLCDEQNMLERIIVGNYLIGRDTLRIVSSKRILSEHISEVRGITRRLIGMSIIEETTNQIILQCSVDPTKFKVDMLLRRLSLISLTMLKEAVQAVLEFDSELARDVIYREDDANALYWLIVRLLNTAQLVKTIANKIKLEGLWEIPENRLISKCLEKIADCSESIAKRANIIAKSDKTLYEEEAIEKLTKFSKLTSDVVQKSMECIFTGDIKEASRALEMRSVLDEEDEKLLMSELPPHFNSIILCLSRIAENSATIAAIAINRALEKPNELCEPYDQSNLIFHS